MFCPTCGKDNSLELKYCASCGTNLEAVSEALSGHEEDFFNKMDAGIDQFIARYTEHVFRNPSSGPTDHKVAKSWKLLGQALLTSLVDILLFTLMWNILPLRFLILLVSTPFRLLSERSGDRQENEPKPLGGYRPPELSAPTPQLWLAESTPSVTEGTTINLSRPRGIEAKVAPVTDRLE